MRRVAIVIAMTLASLAVAAPLALAATLDPAGADSVVLHARREGLDDFCTKPSRPLSTHARSLCPMAAEIPRCDAFVAACNDKPFDPDKLPRWNLGLGSALASLAGGVVWLLVAAVIGLIVAFVVSAIGRARKDSRLASSPEPKATVVPDPMAEALFAPSDAETLLARASEHAQRGELDRAALLYLAAALRALDRRGAIRIARHRTNGEYVRACKESEAAPQLRAIVRAVDRVQFGHEAPTREAIADVAARAAWIVRAAVVASLTLLLVGCTPNSHGPILQTDDPGGDDLFMAVLERQGADVARLGGSLASLPMPEHDEKGPLVVVDAARTPLEDETRVHLVRWVKAGGRLLIAGDVKSWPEDFGAKPHESSSSKLTFRFADPEENDENDFASPADATFKATVAEPHGLDWTVELEASYVLAKNDEEVPYAATRAFERGVVVGLAGDDLLSERRDLGAAERGSGRGADRALCPRATDPHCAPRRRHFSPLQPARRAAQRGAWAPAGARGVRDGAPDAGVRRTAGARATRATAAASRVDRARRGDRDPLRAIPSRSPCALRVRTVRRRTPPRTHAADDDRSGRLPRAPLPRRRSPLRRGLGARHRGALGRSPTR